MHSYGNLHHVTQPHNIICQSREGGRVLFIGEYRLKNQVWVLQVHIITLVYWSSYHLCQSIGGSHSYSGITGSFIDASTSKYTGLPPPPCQSIRGCQSYFDIPGPSINDNTCIYWSTSFASVCRCSYSVIRHEAIMLFLAHYAILQCSKLCPIML